MRIQEHERLHSLDHMQFLRLPHAHSLHPPRTCVNELTQNVRALQQDAVVRLQRYHDRWLPITDFVAARHRCPARNFEVLLVHGANYMYSINTVLDLLPRQGRRMTFATTSIPRWVEASRTRMGHLLRLPR